MLADLLKTHSGQSIPKDFVNAIAIKLGLDLMRPDTLRHHQAQFARLND
jgi:hypothetical protein